MYSNFCGLDFGTSNSTLGVFKNGNADLLCLDKDKQAIRSAIFLNEAEKKAKFGDIAVQEYLNHEEGRLLMSIKSVLGSSIMEEKTLVFNEMISFIEILGFFVKHIKDKSEMITGKELDSVVVGRPVRYHDKDDSIDKRAQDTFELILKSQGFKNVFFQYEPVAAATSFRKANSGISGKYTIVVDIGGGTSDFSLIKSEKYSGEYRDEILSSSGVHIGGTDIDKVLSMKKVMPLLGLGSSMRSSTGKILTLPISPFAGLATWHEINKLYQYSQMKEIQDIFIYALEKDKVNRFLTILKNRDGHRVLECCEKGKIELSDIGTATMDFNFFEKGLLCKVAVNEFNEYINELIMKIVVTISELIKSASITPEMIDSIFFTGGTSKIKFLQEQVLKFTPNAKLIHGDAFGAVGMGLTYQAAEIFS